jgi:hypothetical protein
MSDKTNKKEELESVIDKYTNAWFDGLIKSWKKDPGNKKALKKSYEVVAKLSLESEKEELIATKEAESFGVGLKAGKSYKVEAAHKDLVAIVNDFGDFNIYNITHFE